MGQNREGGFVLSLTPYLPTDTVWSVCTHFRDMFARSGADSSKHGGDLNPDVLVDSLAC